MISLPKGQHLLHGAAMLRGLGHRAAVHLCKVGARHILLFLPACVGMRLPTFPLCAQAQKGRKAAEEQLAVLEEQGDALEQALASQTQLTQRAEAGSSLYDLTCML